MDIPKELFYTKDHEWVRIENGVATFGLTAFAAEQLGDIVFVELPALGDTVSQGDGMGVVESVKTVSDMFAPLSGEVIEQNSSLLQEIEGAENDDFHPEYLNQEPYGKGWLIKIKVSDEKELEELLSSDAYKEIAK